MKDENLLYGVLSVITVLCKLTIINKAARYISQKNAFTSNRVLFETMTINWVKFVA